MIRIGKSNRQVFSVPEDFASQTSALLGVRGSGKTNSAVVMVEALIQNGCQVVVIDPTDVWWGLQSSADGKKAGLPIPVIGGEHSNLPLRDADGAVIADFVVDQQASAILSIDHLSKAGMRRFVLALAERIYHRKGPARYRTPLFVVIDECDWFVPQKLGKGERGGIEARMVGAVEDLVRRGRAKGFGVCLISQRPASINKDVLTQVEWLIAHRHTSPQDRKALDEWIQAHDTQGMRSTFMAQIASLPTGTAYFWSPLNDVFQSVAVDKCSTFDSRQTPRGGRKARGPKRLAQIDLEALKAALAETVEAAESNDPRQLKKQIAQLQRQLDQARHRPADPSAIQDAVSDAVLRERAEWAAQITPLLERARQQLEGLWDYLDTAKLTCCDVERITRPPRSRTRPNKAQSKTSQTAPKPAAISTAGRNGDGGLSRMERALLTALAQHPDGLSKKQILIHANYRSSGPVSTAFATFNKNGWMAECGGRFVITPQGLTALGDFEPLPTGAALRQKVIAESKRVEAAILNVLFDVYPDPITKGEILNRSGYKSSGPVSTVFGRFVAKGYATKAGSGMLRAADEFFE